MASSSKSTPKKRIPRPTAAKSISGRAKKTPLPSARKSLPANEPLNISYDRPAAKLRPKIKPQKPKRKPLHLGAKFSRWIKPGALIATILFILVIAATPASYPVWSKVVSHSVTISAVDAEFGLPLASPSVLVDGKPANYTSDGQNLILSNIATGSHTVTVGGDGYTPSELKITLSPLASVRSEPYFNVTLQPTSRHLQIHLTDIVSKKPVTGAIVKTASGNSAANTEGKAVISEPVSETTIETVLEAPGYDSRRVYIQIEDGKNTVAYDLTPSGRAYYFSKVDNQTNLYSVALDGTNVKTELTSSATESLPPYAYRSPDLRWVAFTSDRSSPSLAKLYLFNTTSGEVDTINDDYARFKIVGWTKENTLLYTIERQTSEFQPANKYQIHLYNPADGSNKTVYSNRSLATNTSKNYKRDQEGYVGIYEELYAEPIIYDGYITYIFRREAKPGFGHLLPPRSYIVIADLSGRTIRTVRENLGGYLYPKDMGNGRISYIDYSSGEKYYELDLVTGVESLLEKKSDEPAKRYRSPDNSKIAWAQKNDTATDIIISNADGSNQRTITSGFGLTINSWFGENYLLIDSADSAFSLHVVSLAGGHPLKLADIQK
jgi:hypothetical protein